MVWIVAHDLGAPEPQRGSTPHRGTRIAGVDAGERGLEGVEVIDFPFSVMAIISIHLYGVKINSRLVNFQQSLPLFKRTP